MLYSVVEKLLLSNRKADHDSSIPFTLKLFGLLTWFHDEHDQNAEWLAALKVGYFSARCQVAALSTQHRLRLVN